MSKGSLAASVLLIGSTLVFTGVRSRTAENTPEQPLADLPRSHGGWKTVRDLPLSDEDLRLLKLSDYVSRVYAAPLPGEGPVVLYVGYYRSQRTGATYHSPLNCLPGAGWQIAETGFVPLPGGRGARVRRLVIEKELRRDLVLYWYQDRGRVITDEYAAKAWLIWDGLKWNRTDGALVRISTPVTTTAEAATERALLFLAALLPDLESRLPDPRRS